MQIVSENDDIAALRVATKQYYNVQQLRMAFDQRKAASGNASKGDIAMFDELGDSYKDLEAKLSRYVRKCLRKIPIYNDFLKQVHGVGPLIAAVLVSNYDINDAPAPEGYGLEHDGAYERDGVVYRMRTVSQFWAYAGLHTVEHNGEMIAARPIKGRVANYNSFLKAKLLKVLGESFIKSNSPYRDFYDVRKKYREEAEWGKNKMHRHRDAIRFMVKAFVMDFFYAWRQIEGLPVRAPYAIEKLGMTPSEMWMLEEHPGWKRREKAAV